MTSRLEAPIRSLVVVQTPTFTYTFGDFADVALVEGPKEVWCWALPKRDEPQLTLHLPPEEPFAYDSIPIKPKPAPEPQPIAVVVAPTATLSAKMHAAQARVNAIGMGTAYAPDLVNLGE